MATIVDPLRVATVLAVTVMIIVIEALAVTTTMTAVIGRPRAADRLMSMAHPEGVMTSPIDGSIHPPTRMLTVVLTIVPREISLLEKVAMGHVKAARILAKIIGEEATGKLLTSNLSECTPLRYLDFEPIPGMN
ncbi:hypothetical protein O1611_g10584 [Lasiodiplodia mahajangana]|uniref:Uncharacterized protein n=1 Tax=Lasiodiplodia mahajangana TaxID=1108764 RepID=A0ACC2IWZ4_9PEZI|nr:hypothetical protein O1611_g10584 [Lasiodiplodia mahajangana]